MLKAWAAVKKAKSSHKKGKINSNELFDIEFYAVETEEEFIKHLEKIKWKTFFYVVKIVYILYNFIYNSEKKKDIKPELSRKSV